MILGLVNGCHEAIVKLRVRGPGGVEAEVDAIVDTGFTSSLTLPAPLAASLGLVRNSGGTVVLADGSVKLFDNYSVEILWDGAWRPVVVSTIGNESLLGMRLLAGHQLVVDVVHQGSVEIRSLARKV